MRKDVNLQREPSEFEMPSYPTNERKYPSDPNNPKRGLALIFNFHEYPGINGPEYRDGSEADLESLKTTLTNLKFDIKVWNEKSLMTVAWFNEKLDEVANDSAYTEAYKNAECFIMVIMGHGESDGYLKAYDGRIQIKDVWGRFTNRQCISLAGKPKLFFIQACRGPEIEECDEAVAEERDDNVSRPTRIIRLFEGVLPQDILLLRPTVEGYVSFRLKESGSILIQKLCEVLNEDIDGPVKKSILTLMTDVIGRAGAMTFADDNEEKFYKQQATLVHNLSAALYLENKNI